MANDISTLIELIETEKDTQKICVNIIKDLKCRNLLFVNLIENLKNLLASPDVSLRRGGTELLSTVLSELPSDFLDFQEIEFLTNFYCDRLRDHHSIIPAILNGFLALIKLNAFPDGQAAKIFTNLNLNFVCQSQPQSDRYICYQILNTMIEKKPSELQALGPDFVCGYLTFIDSERDPRNLMYLFDNLPKFYQNFPPGHLMEDAFEACGCYFPVDFRSSANDPRGISREDLSNALLPCLTALPDFISFCVTLALEKLSSDLKIAKIDSLRLLKDCFDKFPPGKLCSHITEIIPALLNDLKLEQTDSEIHELSIDVLVALIQYLNNYEKFEELTKTLFHIFSSVENYLNDTRLSMFSPAVKFIVKIISACAFACKFMIVKVIQKLLPVKTSSSSDISILLESLKSVLIVCISFNINCSEELRDLWEQVPKLFLSCCESDGEINAVAIECAASIVRLLNSDQRHNLYRILCQNIKDETNVSIKKKYMACLRSVAECYPDEIEAIFKEEFRTNGTSSIELKKSIFQCVCALAPLPNFVTYLPEAVKEYINDDVSEYKIFVIESLRELVMSEERNSTFLNKLHHEMNITKHLMDWWHEGCNAISDNINKIFDDEEVAENLQFIISTIIRVLSETAQKDVAVRYFQLTREYSQRFMSSFPYSKANDGLNGPKIHGSLSIITFESIINGLLPSVAEKTLNDSLSQILRYLCTLAVYCSQPICCSIACKSIATIFNKITEGSKLEEHVAYVYEYACSIISNKDNVLKMNAVNLLIYATKSLLLRGYTEMNLWFDKLLSLIGDESVGAHVADGFRVIFYEERYFLNVSCLCTVKLFYRQRLFSYMIPKLVDIANKCDSGVKANYAISTVNLLQGVPQSVISQYFKRIVPLLVELLDVNCQSALTYDVLEKLTSMLNENTISFEKYVETFIPKLLLMSQNASHMKVRIAALVFLRCYSKLNPAAILPFKTRVVYEIMPCLDDRKRLVRREAVKTRTRWCVLGAE